MTKTHHKFLRTLLEEKGENVSFEEINDVTIERIEIIKSDDVREKKLSLKIMLSEKSTVSTGHFVGVPLTMLKIEIYQSW